MMPKSLRPRHRYVFFEIETWAPVEADEHDLRKQIWFEAQNLFGDLVSSETGVRLVEYDDGVGVVRCVHDRVTEARAALACVHEVDGEEVGVRVRGVSGTLKSGREKFAEEVEIRKVEVDGKTAWKKGDRLDVYDDGFVGTTVHSYIDDERKREKEEQDQP